MTRTNQDGVRPASVDAVLYAGDTATDKTVTLTAEENWTATIKDMPVYAAGKVGEAVNYSLKAAKRSRRLYKRNRRTYSYIYP